MGPWPNLHHQSLLSAPQGSQLHSVPDEAKDGQGKGKELRFAKWVCQKNEEKTIPMDKKIMFPI